MKANLATLEQTIVKLLKPSPKHQLEERLCLPIGVKMANAKFKQIARTDELTEGLS